MNRNDLRFQKTEDGIREAFLYCIDTMGFAETKISDICNRARISRNTFYVHYEDKYSLMKSIYYDLEKEMFHSFEESIKRDLYNYNIKSSVDWCVTEVSKHRELLRILLKCSKSELRESFERVYVDDALSAMTSDYEKRSATIEARLSKAYITNAMVGFIETWLNNYDEISKEKVVELMAELCSAPVKIHMERFV